MNCDLDFQNFCSYHFQFYILETPKYSALCNKEIHFIYNIKINPHFCNLDIAIPSSAKNSGPFLWACPLRCKIQKGSMSNGVGHEIRQLESAVSVGGPQSFLTILWTPSTGHSLHSTSTNPFWPSFSAAWLTGPQCFPEVPSSPSSQNACQVFPLPYGHSSAFLAKPSSSPQTTLGLSLF